MFNTPEGNKVLRYGAIVLIVLAVFLAVQSVYSIVATRNIGYTVPVSNMITVNGTAEKIVVPDVATFTFGAEMTGETVAAAQKVVTERVNAALDVIRKAGVEDKDIKTVAYNINPHYVYSQSPCTQFSCPPSRQTLTGYDVSQTIQVKVRDTAKAGEILGKLGAVEVTNLSGLTFSIDDVEKAQAEARAEAIADARAKAKVLAKNLGVRLGRVVSFNEGYYPMPMYSMMDVAKAENSMGGSAAPVDLPMGENTITSNVSVTYEIR